MGSNMILMIQMAKIRKIDYQFLDTLTPEEIFDYFVSEIYEKTDKEVQDFLLRTAFLPRMTPGWQNNSPATRDPHKSLMI